MTVVPIPFEPNRFRTAAAHYLAGRPPYAPRLIARVAQLCGLGARDRVLDLGCGPGPLARAFAPGVAEVVGIDPEPAMLAAAQAAPGAANVTWMEGSSYDIGPHLGAFKLCCMGRSFHWMDRTDTLRRLDGMIVADGAVSLFHDDHPDIPENGWLQDYRALLKRYHEDGSGRGHWRSGGWVRHEALLLASAFCDLEQVGVITRTEVTTDLLVDRALSMSSTSRAHLGERAETMADEIRVLVAGFAPSGVLPEVVATEALIAWRPGMT